MTTIFEHIVSRRLSQQYEDVATDALAFILDRDKAAREALVELLRSAQPGLSSGLVFSAQDAHAGSRSGRMRSGRRSRGLHREQILGGFDGGAAGRLLEAPRGTTSADVARLRRAERACGDRVARVEAQGPCRTHFWDRTGRYVRFGDNHGVGAWFGIDLSMWRNHGRTPLWVRFWPGAFGHGEVVGPELRRWSVDSGRAVFITADAQVSVGVDLETGVEQDEVIDGVVGQLAALQEVLANVPRTSDEAVPEEAKA
jgi:hypothetical protein